MINYEQEIKIIVNDKSIWTIFIIAESKDNGKTFQTLYDIKVGELLC